MALELSINSNVSNGCLSVIFKEKTGAYSDPDNLGGWGAPNIELADITETHLIITLPDGSTQIDITNPVGLPTDNKDFEYEILAATLDPSTTTVQDGLYIIEYTVTDGITDYTTGPVWFLFLCNIECCVAKLFAKIATITDCSCDNHIIKNALYANALLQGAKANANCGNDTAIASIISKLNKICGITATSCGCSN